MIRNNDVIRGQVSMGKKDIVWGRLAALSYNLTREVYKA
jgi:hypothetical protein